MSGHSKWANIKHKKDAVDQKKGKMFSKVTREIIVAVKRGGADPSANAALRQALIGAKAVNMPNINVERAIKKGAGDATADTFEEIVYEGYAAGGVAVVVECLTDNRNRTGGEVRHIFDKYNGNLAGSGSVTYMFHRKCRFLVTGANLDEDSLMEVVLDAGADDIDMDDGQAEVWGGIDRFEEISKALEKAGFKVDEAGMARRPQTSGDVSDANTASKVMKLLNALEDLDDAQNVYSNIRVSDDVLAELAKES